MKSYIKKVLVCLLGFSPILMVSSVLAQSPFQNIFNKKRSEQSQKKSVETKLVRYSRAYPSAGDSITLDDIKALYKGRLVPIASLRTVAYFDFSYESSRAALVGICKAAGYKNAIAATPEHGDANVKFVVALSRKGKIARIGYRNNRNFPPITAVTCHFR